MKVTQKQVRVTTKSATAIDHIITNSFINCNLTTGIIKTDISDALDMSKSGLAHAYVI